MKLLFLSLFLLSPFAYASECACVAHPEVALWGYALEVSHSDGSIESTWFPNMWRQAGTNEAGYAAARSMCDRKKAELIGNGRCTDRPTNLVNLSAFQGKFESVEQHPGCSKTLTIKTVGEKELILEKTARDSIVDAGSEGEVTFSGLVTKQQITLGKSREGNWTMEAEFRGASLFALKAQSSGDAQVYSESLQINILGPNTLFLIESIATFEGNDPAATKCAFKKIL